MPWFCAVPTSKIKVFKVRSKFLLKMLALLPLNYEKMLEFSSSYHLLLLFWQILKFSYFQSSPSKADSALQWLQGLNISGFSNFYRFRSIQYGYRSIYIRPFFFVEFNTNLHKISHAQSEALHDSRWPTTQKVELI